MYIEGIQILLSLNSNCLVTLWLNICFVGNILDDNTCPRCPSIDVMFKFQIE